LPRLRFLIPAVLFVISAVFSSCGERGQPLLAGHPGYPVYRKYCRRCHGDRGDGVRASRLAERRLDLGSPAFRDTVDAAEIERVVRLGRGRMKGYAETLRPDEIDGVVFLVLGLAEARREAPAP
jgi:mono/diheme cytochrome c family protein